jgi:hypothetical protein
VRATLISAEEMRAAGLGDMLESARHAALVRPRPTHELTHHTHTERAFLRQVPENAHEVLREPIAREVEACARFVSLLRTHLESYATSAVVDAYDMQSGRLGPEEDAATRLVHFEKALLGSHVRALSGEGSLAQPQATLCDSQTGDVLPEEVEIE